MHPSGPGLRGLCPVTEHLYLGGARAAADALQLRRCGVTCVVNASEDGDPPPGLDYVHVPVRDSPLAPLWAHFDAVADAIERTAAHGGRTLVHCRAGVSRSAALCMAYLLKHRGLTLLEAHAAVRACRPQARPNTGFWEQLIRYELELRGSSSVRMVSSSMGDIPDIYLEEARNMVPL